MRQLVQALETTTGKKQYGYLEHGIVVKISFAGKRSMEESIVHYINTMEG